VTYLGERSMRKKGKNRVGYAAGSPRHNLAVTAWLGWDAC
jgi:hypothetical protein